MATRPSTLPTFATDGAAVIEEPAAARKLAGWQFEDVLTEGELNWHWNLVGQWIGYLDSLTAAVPYSHIGVALEVLSVGDLGLVDGYDAGAPLSAMDSVVLTSGSAVGQTVRSAGRYVAYLNRMAGEVDIVDRNSLVVVANFGVPGDATGLAFDGVRVWVAGTTTVEAWNLTGHPLDGSSAAPGTYRTWSVSVASRLQAVHDLCCDGVRVFVVGERNTHSLVALDIADGSVLWSYDHDDDLFATCCDGSRVFVAGTASGFASAAAHRAVVASNGRDAAGEGGNGIDTTALAWDSTAGSGTTAPDTLKTDGRVLLSGAGSSLLALAVGAGASPLSTMALPGNAKSVSLDREFFYATDASGAVTAWARAGGGLVAVATGASHVEADEFGLWAGNEVSSTVSRLRRGGPSGACPVRLVNGNGFNGNLRPYVVER